MGKDPSVTAETGLLPGGIMDHDGRKTTTRRCCVVILRRTTHRRRRRMVLIEMYDIREKMSMSGINTKTSGQSNLTKSASRGAHSPLRGHPRGEKVVPLNSWGRVSY